MADPHHVPTLDGFDRFTVNLYRAGILTSAGALLMSGSTHLILGQDATVLAPTLWLTIAVGAALAVQNMHLYDKRVRWVIGAAAWVGVVLQLSGPEFGDGVLALWVRTAGLGFTFVALSGFALKEQFCFRIPGLRLVPLILAGSLIAVLAGQPMVTGLMHLLAGMIYGALAVAKLRMPLHFDVGDKSRYQI